MGPTTIANLALSWMGENSINDIDDSQKQAQIMKANYVPSRNLVLEARPWSFALERQVLSPVSDAPAFGIGNKFLIPSTVAKVWRCFKPYFSPNNKFTNADWVREGQFIIAPEETVWVMFIMKVDNVNLFLPSFVHALAARMAADTATSLTEDKTLQDRMEKLYNSKLADAAASDGLQGRSEIISSTRLTGVRNM